MTDLDKLADLLKSTDIKHHVGHYPEGEIASIRAIPCDWPDDYSVVVRKDDFRTCLMGFDITQEWINQVNQLRGLIAVASLKSEQES